MEDNATKEMTMGSFIFLVFKFWKDFGNKIIDANLKRLKGKYRPWNKSDDDGEFDSLIP